MPEGSAINLNEEQHSAVEYTKGPLLVVAGAGSGKTRVIIEKIKHLISEGMKPWQILAITFTNKAATEMKERMLRDNIEAGAWVCTFHSMSVRILRKECHHLGLSEQFSIFDTDDQTSVIKTILKEMELDPEDWKPAKVLSGISEYKSKGIDANEAEESAIHYRDRIRARIYALYEKALNTNQALDFDDLLLKTLELFRKHSAVLENYQDRFRYILVDEYQDTNTIQYQLIHSLSKKCQGLTLTGDPDQSIYSWRGADINNILNFQKDFPGAHVIKLQWNYRSYKLILELANQLIRNNTERYPKELMSENQDGPYPLLHFVESADEESRAIAHLIAMYKAKDKALNDIAVFYRTNAQSRVIEEGLREKGIPYIIIGGVRFFDRMEVKDLIAYLRFIHNPKDSISLMRIINKPARGISETTKAKIRGFADDNGLSCWEALMHDDFLSSLAKRARDSINAFNQLAADFFEHSFSSPDIMLEKIIENTKYLDLYRKKGDDSEEERVENIKEFLSYTIEYAEKNQNSTLSTLLEEIALITDKKEAADDDEPVVTLMTLHAAKGLEFPYVFLSGLDEGILPHQRSLDAGSESAIEEERRLLYVGITRAERELHMFQCAERFTFKGPKRFKPSRFIPEMQGPYLSTNKRGRVQKPKTRLDLFKGASDEIRKGEPVRHEKYGKGVVLDLKGRGASRKAKIYFDRCGEKSILLQFEKLESL